MRFIRLFSNIYRGGVIVEVRRGLRMHSRLGPTVEEVSAIREELHGGLSAEKIIQRKKYPVPKINNVDVRAKRSAIFTEEARRQLEAVGRIEKIEVMFEGLPEGNVTMMMNKSISTPFHIAQHLSELHANRSIVADVNGELWDVNRPLVENCKLRLLHMRMKDEDLFKTNRVFWRSCSLMMGCVAERAFRDHIYVELHSFPPPVVRSGSFVYDVDIKFNGWTPNSDEMRVLSAEFRKLSQENLPFERLEVSPEVALQMFEDNVYKKQQIPSISSSSPEGKITLYRIGDFVDISKGPMMANTNQIGRATVTAMIPLKTSVSSTLHRFQGVALPANFLLNHFAWGLIEDRGKKLNSARIPGQEMISDEEESKVQLVQ